jgi:hypothetical protein
MSGAREGLWPTCMIASGSLASASKRCLQEAR